MCTCTSSCFTFRPGSESDCFLYQPHCEGTTSRQQRLQHSHSPMGSWSHSWLCTLDCEAKLDERRPVTYTRSHTTHTHKRNKTCKCTNTHSHLLLRTCMCSKGAHRTQALALSLGEPMTAGGAYTSRLGRLSLAVFAWTSATRDQQGSVFFLISSTNIRKATTISSLPPFHCFFRSVSICCYVLAVFWCASRLPKLARNAAAEVPGLAVVIFHCQPALVLAESDRGGQRDVVIWCNIWSNKWLCLKLGYPWLPQLLMCYLIFIWFFTLLPLNTH